MIDVDALRSRLADVRARIARAASRAGRDPASIRLVAVSKTFSAQFVRAAAEAGQVDFGENKVQEALQKMDEVGSASGGAASGLRWHLVGHLQSNKAKKAAARFHVIHSIDSAALLRKVDEYAREAGRQIEVLVQVDLAGEATKFGAAEDDLPSILDAARSVSHAQIRGLMLLPPAVDNPNDARGYFRALRAVRDRLVDRGVDPRQLAELSMGMSHDFEVAIEEGATLVRVGSAIFGDRPFATAR